jgi:hypothetical protein
VKRRDAFFDALNNDPAINMKMASMMNEVMQDEFECDTRESKWASISN